MGIAAKKLDRFLSGLALAEKAAAVQCDRLSKDFAQMGLNSLAAQYETFSKEEWGHYHLVSSLVQEGESYNKLHDPRLVHLLGLDGRFREWSIGERLYCIHVVFEPSALSHLSGLIRPDVISKIEPRRAAEISRVFTNILREEGTHIYLGGRALQRFLPELAASEQARAERNERLFIKVIKGSISELLSDPEETLAKESILKTYEGYLHRQRKQVVCAI
jgi:hypothetical protein